MPAHPLAPHTMIVPQTAVHVTAGAGSALGAIPLAAVTAGVAALEPQALAVVALASLTADLPAAELIAAVTVSDAAGTQAGRAAEKLMVAARATATHNMDHGTWGERASEAVARRM